MSRSTSVRTRLGNALDPLWEDGKGPILLTISAGWFLTLGVRIVYPALLPDMMTEFQIDYTRAGFLLSAIWVSYASMQFVGGLLADRFGERAVVFASVSSALGAVVLIILAPAFSMFVFATVLLGLGTGLYGTTRVTVLSDVYPDKRTTAVSVSQAFGNVGNAILPVIGGVLAAAVGWRLGFGYLIPLFAVTAVAAFYYVPRRTSPAPESEFGTAYLRELVGAMSTRTVVAVGLFHFALMFYYQGVTGFLPSYLIDIKGFPQATASIIYGGFFVSAIVFQFVSGPVADRFGERRAIIALIAIGLPGAALLPFVTAPALVVPVTFLCAAVLGAFPPGHTYAVELIPDTLQGSGYGLLRTVYIGLAASAPPITGYIADGGYFPYIFVLFAAIAACAAAICFRLPSIR